MKKYDRSLIEVWEWKEKVYHNVRDLSPKEYLVKIKNDTDKILSESHIKLKTISSKGKEKKVA